MNEKDSSLFFKAVNDCDMFIYRARTEDPEFGSKYSALEIYNMWIADRGFALHNDEDLIGLIDHIGKVVMIPLFCLSGCLENDGLFHPEMSTED